MDFLSLAHFALTPMTLSMAMTGMAVLGFGVWILTISYRSQSHNDFFILCCALAGWLIMEAAEYSAIQPEVALVFSRLMWCSVLFIAPATMALNLNLLGYKELRQNLAPIFYIIALIFLPLVWTDWFISGNGALTGHLSIAYTCGPANFAYWLIFIVTFVLLLFIYYRRMRNPILPPHDRGIYRLIFAATIVGAIGLLDWLQCAGVSIPPVGFLPVLIWITLYAYAIFRYRLFQLTLNVAGPTIIETLPGALFVVNTGGEIVIVNPGARTLTGETDQALLGRNIRDFLPVAGKTLECALLNLEAGSCAVNGLETDLRVGKNKMIPISLSARVIRRPDGVPNGAIFIAVEISRLKEQMTLVESQKAELINLVEEMGRTQKMLIGRENQMVELKKEIDELKSQGGR